MPIEITLYYITFMTILLLGGGGYIAKAVWDERRK